MTLLNPCGCFSSCTKRLPCSKRLETIEKCESQFLAEIDIGTMIKRIRRSYHSLGDIRDKKLRKYLKLNKANIIVSDNDSDEKDHEFEVEKGYFSSSSDNMDEIIQVHKKDEFDKNLREQLRVNCIGNMPISDEQKLLLLDPEIKIGKPTLGEDDIDVFHDREESEVEEESYGKRSKVATVEEQHEQ